MTIARLLQVSYNEFIKVTQAAKKLNGELHGNQERYILNGLSLENTMVLLRLLPGFEEVENHIY